MNTESIIPHHRIWLILLYLFIFGCTQSLREPNIEADSVRWYDDYFTVEYIDSQTIAIGEPRYHQQNYSYLILGNKRALLFDTGPGIRNIKPVVESLTSLPVTITQSHFHYDHVGNHRNFDGAAVADLPVLRERAKSGGLDIYSKELLGFVENIDKPTIVIKEWWPLNSAIELGDRSLKILHAPGHTKESIVLVDEARGFLFTGDFLCPGPNLAALPGSSLDDYLETAHRLLAMSTSETKLLTAHRDEALVKFGEPVLAYEDLIDFENSLEKIIDGTKEGKGLYVKSYKINDRIEFIVNR